jgi:hypothetical protein
MGLSAIKVSLQLQQALLCLFHNGHTANPRPSSPATGAVTTAMKSIYRQKEVSESKIIGAIMAGMAVTVAYAAASTPHATRSTDQTNGNSASLASPVIRDCTAEQVMLMTQHRNGAVGKKSRTTLDQVVQSTANMDS